jgi:hypothetical protein
MTLKRHYTLVILNIPNLDRIISARTRNHRHRVGSKYISGPDRTRMILEWMIVPSNAID